jgi:riboflavin synthase
MFTGLVEETGTVHAVHRRNTSLRLEIACTRVLEDLSPGDSISIEGACQTVVHNDTGGFAVDTLAETLRKTTLGRLRPGDRVNLERAVRVGDRLGGHLVQGHVDGVGVIESLRQNDNNIYLSLSLDRSLHRYCISEGSIAVAGISLTIAACTGKGVTINIIPETWNRTTLRYRSIGDPVNIETDLIARYVEQLFPGRTATLHKDTLSQWGYGGTT